VANAFPLCPLVKARLLTCNIANLCISPLHAGIKLFRTPNSSFILLLLRRSIKLCAVFLAIFLPAALVALGCFLLAPVAAGVCAVAVAFFAAVFAADAEVCGCSSRGFIWIILRERVGGGGRLNCSVWAVVEGRLRLLTASDA
jgi:hypothetical protein